MMKKRLLLGFAFAIFSMCFAFVSCEFVKDDDNNDDNNGNQATHQHIPAECVRENEVFATCLVHGHYEEVIYCADPSCGTEISRAYKTLPKTVCSYVDGICTACGGFKYIDSGMYTLATGGIAEIDGKNFVITTNDEKFEYTYEIKKDGVDSKKTICLTTSDGDKVAFNFEELDDGFIINGIKYTKR